MKVKFDKKFRTLDFDFNEHVSFKVFGHTEHGFWIDVKKAPELLRKTQRELKKVEKS